MPKRCHQNRKFIPTEKDLTSPGSNLALANTRRQIFIEQQKKEKPELFLDEELIKKITQTD